MAYLIIRCADSGKSVRCSPVEVRHYTVLSFGIELLIAHLLQSRAHTRRSFLQQLEAAAEQTELVEVSGSISHLDLCGAVDGTLENVNQLALVLRTGERLEPRIAQGFHETPQVVVAAVLDESPAGLRE